MLTVTNGGFRESLEEMAESLAQLVVVHEYFKPLRVVISCIANEQKYIFEHSHISFFQQFHYFFSQFLGGAVYGQVVHIGKDKADIELLVVIEVVYTQIFHQMRLALHLLDPSNPCLILHHPSYPPQLFYCQMFRIYTFEFLEFHLNLMTHYLSMTEFLQQLNPSCRKQ